MYIYTLYSIHHCQLKGPYYRDLVLIRTFLAFWVPIGSLFIFQDPFYHRQVIYTSAFSEMANITPSSASDKALLSLKTSPAYRIQMESHSISLPKYLSIFLREIFYRHGHLRPSETLWGHPRPSKTIEYHWIPLNTIEYNWKPLNTIKCQDHPRPGQTRKSRGNLGEI